MSEAIQDGWEVKPLGELADVVSGGTPSRAESKFWDGGTINWATPSDITKTRGNILNDTSGRITDLGLAGCSAKLLPAGTLLMTSRATLGEIRLAGTQTATNQGFKSLIPKDGTDNWFLLYQLQRTKAKYEVFGIGTTFLEVNKKDTQRFPVHAPPLPTQRRIAEVLRTVDEVIEWTEARIEKQQAIKQGLLHDLFTRGLTPDGELRPPPTDRPDLYQDSPLGLIPKEWEVKTLQECCSALITYGIVQAGPDYEGGVPYIRTGDMTGGELRVDTMLRTDPRITASYKRSEVREGEIVCAIRASVGHVLRIPKELDGANLTQGTARIAPSKETNGGFLLWAIRSDAVQRAMEKEVKGTTFVEITLADLRTIPIARPKQLSEQAAIADAMAAQEAKISQQQAHLTKLRHLKSALMQDLLTGRVSADAIDPEAFPPES